MGSWDRFKRAVGDLLSASPKKETKKPKPPEEKALEAMQASGGPTQGPVVHNIVHNVGPLLAGTPSFQVVRQSYSENIVTQGVGVIEVGGTRYLYDRAYSLQMGLQKGNDALELPKSFQEQGSWEKKIRPGMLARVTRTLRIKGGPKWSSESVSFGTNVFVATKTKDTHLEAGDIIMFMGFLDDNTSELLPNGNSPSETSARLANTGGLILRHWPEWDKKRASEGAVDLIGVQDTDTNCQYFAISPQRWLTGDKMVEYAFAFDEAELVIPEKSGN